MAAYPVVPLRDIVVFPGFMMPLFIGRPRTLAAVAAAAGGSVLLVAQRDSTLEDPMIGDLYGIGTVARVLQQAGEEAGTIKILVTGERRARIHTVRHDDYLTAEVEDITDPASPPSDLARVTADLAQDFTRRFGTLADILSRPKDGEATAGLVATMQRVLELPDLSAAARLEKLKAALG